MAQQLELGLISTNQMNQSEWQEYLSELAGMSKSEKQIHLMLMDFNNE
jgi:hypothetical protein